MDAFQIKKIQATFTLPNGQGTNQVLVLIAPVITKTGKIGLEKEMFGYHIEADENSKLVKFPFTAEYGSKVKKFVLCYGETFRDQEAEPKETIINPRGCQYHELQGLVDVVVKVGVKLKMIAGDEVIDMAITEIVDPF